MALAKMQISSGRGLYSAVCAAAGELNLDVVTTRHFLGPTTRPTPATTSNCGGAVSTAVRDLVHPGPDSVDH
jgi:hypothetical protein